MSKKHITSYEKPDEDPLTFLGELTYGLLRGDYELVKSQRVSDDDKTGYTDCEYRFVCKTKSPHSGVRAQ